METTSLQKHNGYIVIGGIGMVLAIGYLWMSFHLPFGKLDEPGAGVFPVIVGVILMLASLTVIWEGCRLDKAERINFPAGADRYRLLSLLGLLFGYFLAIPWLGQTISCTLFYILFMRVLSDLSWPRILVYSLAMSITLYVVFVFLLRVPMPSGLLVFYN